MSEYSLINDLVVWSKSTFGLNCQVIKRQDTYHIYIDGIRRCRFQTKTLDGLKRGLAMFKVHFSHHIFLLKSLYMI